MTMEKYGIDYAAVKRLMDQGASEEEALEKVASGVTKERPPETDKTPRDDRKETDNG
jgi:hypothetical protein